MASVQRYFLIRLAIACLLAHSINAKTVFRRTDKLTDDFKQLNLPPEEIDPNVAPPEPQKVETINPEDVIVSTSAPAPQALGALVEDVSEVPNVVSNDLIDETLNEVDTGSIAAAPAPTIATAPTTVAPVPAASGSSSLSSSASSAASGDAVPSSPTSSTPINNVDDPSAISKYCKCSDSHCDCCREFGLPLIPIRGPGCAKITYLGDQKMSVSIKYGDITLATRTISGKKARPICVGLPGGYSQFCGRVYGLSKAKENFKACLGFELRADDEVEASLRVSCFKFGPDGLRVAEAEPLPSEVNKEEDDDDDDDIFGFAAGGDDEDDDYDDDDIEEPEEADSGDDDVDDDDDEYPAEGAEAPADADYGGFSLGGLIDELTDDDEEETTPESQKPVVTPVRTPASIDTSAQTKEAKGNEVGCRNVFLEESKANSDSPSPSVEEVAATPKPFAAEETTSKSTKSKKSKKNKNKKKKAVSDDTESDFAFELLNGILDFFN